VEKEGGGGELVEEKVSGPPWCSGLPPQPLFAQGLPSSPPPDSVMTSGRSCWFCDDLCDDLGRGGVQQPPPAASVAQGLPLISAVLGRSTNPREVFARLREELSAVVAGWDNWKFPGARQRPTPVVDARG
jgi:hypothetical protein